LTSHGVPQPPFLGVLMPQTRFPKLPGDVGHPASFSMPVHHRVVAGASPQRVTREGDPSLLALPGLERPGVPTVDAASLGPARLRAAGADPDTPVEGLQAGGHLQRTLLDDLPGPDPVEAEAEVLASAGRLLRRCPGLRSLVLECTNLPPDADALRRSTGLPVHHLMTLVHDRWSLMT
jgi:hypothetical protein